MNGLLAGSGLVERPADGLLFNDFAVYPGLVSAYMPFMIFPIWISIASVERRASSVERRASSVERRNEEASWMLG